MIAGNPGAAMDENHSWKSAVPFGLKKIEMHFTGLVSRINETQLRLHALRKIRSTDE